MTAQSKIAPLWAAATVLTMGGCAGSLDLHAQPSNTFDEQISRAIPIGMRLSQAQALLTANGYHCFRGAGSDPRPLIACVDRKYIAGYVVPRDWAIKLYYGADDRVIDIAATVYPAYAFNY